MVDLKAIKPLTKEVSVIFFFVPRSEDTLDHFLWKKPSHSA